jgi:hypothetical protein
MKKSFIGQGTSAKVSARVRKDIKVKKGFVGQGKAAIVETKRKS